MLTAVTHITMFVHDQEATLTFYKKLGCIVHTDTDFDGMRWLTLCFPNNKNFELAILTAETDFEKSLVGKQASDKPFLSLESTDCLKDFQTLKALGIDIQGQPEHMPWGICMSLHDNSGNKIYVCQPA